MAFLENVKVSFMYTTPFFALQLLKKVHFSSSADSNGYAYMDGNGELVLEDIVSMCVFNDARPSAIRRCSNFNTGVRLIRIRPHHVNVAIKDNKRRENPL